MSVRRGSSCDASRAHPVSCMTVVAEMRSALIHVAREGCMVRSRCAEIPLLLIKDS